MEEWKQWQLKLISKRVTVIKAVLSAKVSLRSFQQEWVHKIYAVCTDSHSSGI